MDLGSPGEAIGYSANGEGMVTVRPEGGEPADDYIVQVSTDGGVSWTSMPYGFGPSYPHAEISFDTAGMGNIMFRLMSF